MWVNRERSCLAAASSVCDSTKHNGLVTTDYHSNVWVFGSLLLDPHCNLMIRLGITDLAYCLPWWEWWLAFPWLTNRSTGSWGRTPGLSSSGTCRSPCSCGRSRNAEKDASHLVQFTTKTNKKEHSISMYIILMAVQQFNLQHYQRVRYYLHS